MSFRDTFTREEEKENVLDYDDSAFLYVAGTFLLFVLIPWTLRLIWAAYYNNAKGEANYPARAAGGKEVAYCKCSVCREGRAGNSGPAAVGSGGWRSLRITALVFLWAVFALVVVRLLGVNTSIQSFDPYEILQISIAATDKEIKKAYRVMSLRLHPDKNPNDPTASAKFVMISKAYAALTDELAKVNFEKYGNPDGPSAMKVGIGLPKMLVAEANQLFVLIVFFVFLLVVVPSAFIVYFRRQRLFAPNGVRLETLHFYARYLTEGTRVKLAPEFLAAAAESREMQLRDGDEGDINRLGKEIEQPKKCGFQNPVVVRNYLLVLAHMQRKTNLLAPPHMEDLNFLLGKSIGITGAMLEISFYHKWLLTAQSMLDFRRRLVQALDFTAPPGLQLPNPDLVQKKTKNLSELVRHKEKEYEKFSSCLSPEQFDELKAVIDHLPCIEMQAKVFVDDEEEIVTGDIATIAISLKRTQLKENQVAGPIHAPQFPETKFEEWWIFATEKPSGNIVGFVKSKVREQFMEEKIQFQVPAAGRHSLLISALCDSYVGLDRLCEVQFRVHAPKDVKREIFVHPDDAALDKEPTFFQQMAGLPMKTESSDEE